MGKSNFKVKTPSGSLEQVISFNVLRDVKEVESGLAVNIDDMLRTGIVKDSSATLDNNGIDDPNNIIGLVRDEFSAIDAMRAIRKYGRKGNRAAESAAKEAAGIGAPAPSSASSEASIS